jgi:hypothetical protein
VFDFHKPDWLYEALPYVYVVAGIATIANLGNALSIVSGGLLVSAGVFIWWMRRTYRRNQQRKSADRRTVDRRATDRRSPDRTTLEQIAAERRATDRRETARRQTERRQPPP